MSIKKFKKEDALAGSLHKYAKNVPKNLSMKKIRDMAWEKAVCEKERKRSIKIDAYEKILKSRDAFLKAGVLSDKVYKESKEQLEKRPLKRKKITNELLKLSKHTHPISTKEIVGDIRNDRRRPKLDISIDEAIEKAIEIVARKKGRIK